MSLNISLISYSTLSIKLESVLLDAGGLIGSSTVSGGYSTSGPAGWTLDSGTGSGL